MQTWQSWGPQGRFEDGDATIQIDFKNLQNGATEMTQTAWGSAYKDSAKIDMSIDGTIETHEGLAKFVESGTAW